MSLIESAAEQAGFRVFASVLRASPYRTLFDTGRPYTIFAPADSAFQKFSQASLDQLLGGDGEVMRTVLGYHFAPGKVMAARFNNKRIRATMHAGGDVIIDGKNGLHVNGARLTEPDIAAGQSVIHGIDAVLWPREPAAAAR